MIANYCNKNIKLSQITLSGIQGVIKKGFQNFRSFRLWLFFLWLLQGLHIGSSSRTSISSCRFYCKVMFFIVLPANETIFQFSKKWSSQRVILKSLQKEAFIKKIHSLANKCYYLSYLTIKLFAIKTIWINVQKLISKLVWQKASQTLRPKLSIVCINFEQSFCQAFIASMSSDLNVS